MAEWLIYNSTVVTDASFIPKETTAYIAVRISSTRQLMVATEEVSVGQWRACEAAASCPILAGNAADDHPMVNMSWEDVQQYIRWSSTQQQLALRVPTKAEWLVIAEEQAPKAKQPLFTDPRVAWAAAYDIDALPHSRVTEPSGSFGRNSRGVFDLTGNVWEWVADCYFEQPGLSVARFGCVNGRMAMGERVVGLSERLRKPGNSGCSGGQPPANVGVRLVYEVKASGS